MHYNLQPDLTVAGDVTTAAIRSVGLRRGGWRWRSITWMVLLAFSLQSYLTQTHIHDASLAVGNAAIVTLDVKAAAHKTTPNENGTSDCPFCQAIAYAGVFFTPAAPLYFLPALTGHLALTPVAGSIALAGAAHTWQSRAPPRH